jgi:hypothetical protein
MMTFAQKPFRLCASASLRPQLALPSSPLQARVAASWRQDLPWNRRSKNVYQRFPFACSPLIVALRYSSLTVNQQHADSVQGRRRSIVQRRDILALYVPSMVRREAAISNETKVLLESNLWNRTCRIRDDFMTVAQPFGRKRHLRRKPTLAPIRAHTERGSDGVGTTESKEGGQQPLEEICRDHSAASGRITGKMARQSFSSARRTESGYPDSERSYSAPV